MAARVRRRSRLFAPPPDVEGAVDADASISFRPGAEAAAALAFLMKVDRSDRSEAVRVALVEAVEARLRAETRAECQQLRADTGDRAELATLAGLLGTEDNDDRSP